MLLWWAVMRLWILALNLNFFLKPNICVNAWSFNLVDVNNYRVNPWEPTSARCFRDWSFGIVIKVCTVPLGPCSPPETCTCSDLKTSCYKQEQVKKVLFLKVFVEYWNRDSCFGSENLRKIIEKPGPPENADSCCVKAKWHKAGGWISVGLCKITMYSESITEKVWPRNKLCAFIKL